MSGQRDDAAERSAHVTRGETAENGPSLFVEGPGPSAQLAVVAALRADNARLREAHDELSRYSDAEITRLRRLWTYLEEAAADPDTDEPMKAAEWLAEFEQAEKARAALSEPAP